MRRQRWYLMFVVGYTCNNINCLCDMWFIRLFSLICAYVTFHGMVLLGHYDGCIYFRWKSVAIWKNVDWIRRYHTTAQADLNQTSLWTKPPLRCRFGTCVMSLRLQNGKWGGWREAWWTTSSKSLCALMGQTLNQAISWYYWATLLTFSFFSPHNFSFVSKMAFAFSSSLWSKYTNLFPSSKSDT